MFFEGKIMHGLICGVDYIKIRRRKHVEIVSYVKNGLQPYDEMGVPILPPGSSDLIILIRELSYDIECIEMDFPEFKDENIIHAERNSLLTSEQINPAISDKLYYWAGNIAEVKEEYKLKKIQREHSENKLEKYYQLPSWKGYQFPMKPEGRKLVLDELLKALYKWEDILKLEKEIGMKDILELEKELRNGDKTTDKVVLNSALPQQEYIGNVAENAFLRKGIRPDESWEVWFKGKKLDPIMGSGGMDYIANLLLKPGHSIHVTDLCNSVKPTEKRAMMEEDDLTDSLREGTMNISDMQDDGIDGQGKQSLKNKFYELKEIMNDPTLPSDERVKASAEHEKMIKTLTSVYGIRAIHHHAPRKVNESVKQDMDRAKKAIKRACEKIQKQSPDLAEYLKLNIKTGTLYIFMDKDSFWRISF